MSSQKVYDIWLKTRKTIDYLIYNSLYKPESEEEIIQLIDRLNTQMLDYRKNPNDELNEEYYLNNYIKLPIESINNGYASFKLKLMEYIDRTLIIKINGIEKQIGEKIIEVAKDFMSSSILKYNYILEGIDPTYLIKEKYIKTFDNESILLEIPVNEILVISYDKKETLLYFTFDKYENLYSNKSLQLFSEYNNVENGELVFIEDQLGELPDIGFKFGNLFFLINNIDYSIKQLAIKGNWKGVENDLQTMIGRLKSINI